MNIGTDPEFFIISKKTGRPVPAHRVGLGDKNAKRDFSGVHESMTLGFKTYGAGGKAFRDGYALEVNTMPTTCRGTLIAIVANVLRAVGEMIGPEYTFSTEPALRIDLDDLRGAPIDLLSFGCDPAWNAYTLSESVSPLDASMHAHRYTGGHMHFGINKMVETDSPLMNEANYPLLAKMMDLWVAIPLAFLTSNPATFERRQYYGKAGEFRIQKYPGNDIGFEYRVPGSDLYNHHFLVQLAFGAGRGIINNFKALAEKWNPKLEPKIRKAVNTGVGLEELLGTVNGFYNPKILREAREFYKKEFRSFNLPLDRAHVTNKIVQGPGSDIMFYQHMGWSAEVVSPGGTLGRHTTWNSVEATGNRPSIAA